MSSWKINQPPIWHPNAIATPAGWADPITGELLVAIVGLSTIKEPGGAPTLVSVYPDKLTYKHGDTLHVIAQYSAPVVVTGTPTVGISVNGSNHTINYASGSGSAFLKFNYTVGGSDVATATQFGISSPISLAGGTIKDAGTATNAPLSWTVADARVGKTVIDAVLPTISGITAPTGSVVTNQQLNFTVTFSKAVFVIGNPTMTVNFPDGTDGATAGTAVYQSGSGTTTLVYQYVVQSDDAAILTDITVNSPLLIPYNSAIIDEVGNPATLTHSATFPNTGINDAGSVVTVALTQNDYKTGDVMSFNVTFDQVVLVGGTPQLPININSGAQNALYSAGTGTNTLTFTYTVGSGDAAATSQLTTGTLLALNGGSIKDLMGTAVSLSFSQVSFTTITVNTPYVASVAAPVAGNMITAAHFDLTVTFTEAVTVATAVPYIVATIGSNARHAVYTSGSGTTALLFRYSIVSGDAATAGNVSIGASIQLNGATIQNAATTNAILTLGSVDVSGVVVNDPAPTISTVAIAAGNYQNSLAQNIPVVVTFNKAVAVTGTPTIALTINAGSKTATYASGSGTTALTFNYVVASGDSGAVTCTATSLGVGSATIKDALGTSVTNSFSAPTITGVLANDVVASFTAAMSGTGSAYPVSVTGDTISVTLTANKAVTVTGSPYLPAVIGGVAAQIPYVSGSGTTALVFTYTVGAGDFAAAEYFNLTPLVSLNGGTLVDAAGISVVLGFTSPDIRTLSFNAAPLSDTPVTFSAAVLGGDGPALVTGNVLALTLTATRNVTVSTSNGTPYVSLQAGKAGRKLAYASGSGSTSLVFYYTAQSTDSAVADSVSVGKAVVLNGGTLKDSSGVSVVLDFVSPSAETVTFN